MPNPFISLLPLRIDERGENPLPPIRPRRIKFPISYCRQYKSLANLRVGKTPFDSLNICPGFPYLPVRGDWGLLQEHIRRNICGDREDCYEYLMNWMSKGLQVDGPMGSAIVLQGDEGVGKNVFVEQYRALFAPSTWMEITSKNQIETFNGQMENPLPPIRPRRIKFPISDPDPGRDPAIIRRHQPIPPARDRHDNAGGIDFACPAHSACASTGPPEFSDPGRRPTLSPPLPRFPGWGVHADIIAPEPKPAFPPQNRGFGHLALGSPPMAAILASSIAARPQSHPNRESFPQLAARGHLSRIGGGGVGAEKTSDRGSITLN